MLFPFLFPKFCSDVSRVHLTGSEMWLTNPEPLLKTILRSVIIVVPPELVMPLPHTPNPGYHLKGSCAHFLPSCEHCGSSYYVHSGCLFIHF